MSAQSNGLVAAAKQNEAGGVTPHNVSTFPLSYSFYNTERFGELTPFHVEEGVSGDRLPLHSSHELRTYTLQAPLMQSLLKKKDFFYVPMQAILPLNWEKFYTNPVIGQDVPNDVGCGVEGFWNKVETLFRNSHIELRSRISNVGDTIADFASLWGNIFTFLVFFEYFYSCGSLMKTLGISGHNFCHINFEPSDDDDSSVPTQSVSYDFFFDQMVSLFVKYVARFDCSVGDSSYLVYTSDSMKNDGYGQPSKFIIFREFFELLRDDLTNLQIRNLYFNEGFTSAGLRSDLSALFSRFVFLNVLNSPVTGEPISDDFNVSLNLSRLWAYQLVCAHFYSNDHVDFVYSAELFRQYIWQCFRVFSNDFIGETNLETLGFSVNGFSYEYDALSAFVCSYFFRATNIFDSALSSEFFAYFTALLHYKRSLRYMDYFTGARTRPLAIGDASVDVADSKVDVLDLSRSRMMAKFLQAVNRSGRKFGAYMKELFGKVPAPDYHNPFYLAHTSDVVGSSENQNTADGQRDPNAFTSNLITNASRYAFMFHPDRDCIVIGITYYDIPRVYTRATERQNFFVDRFDMFNPYLQFIGDQPIYTAELGTDSPSLLPFGYQNRHMEYKQRYNQAAGAFADKMNVLKNWIFIADSLRRSEVSEVNSAFIRSFNSELDHFYTSLTGWSNGSYFHFICRYDNRQDATRPMAYAPVIA